MSEKSEKENKKPTQTKQLEQLLILAENNLTLNNANREDFTKILTTLDKLGVDCTVEYNTICNQLGGINTALNNVIQVVDTLVKKVDELAKRPATPTQSTIAPTKPAPTTTTAPLKVTDGFLTAIKNAFPDEHDEPNDLRSRLEFVNKGDYVIIKPKTFLGSNRFAKLAEIVRAKGGEYISAGRDSHFRVYPRSR